MLTGDIIGIVLGLAFIYTVLSLVTTSLTEFVIRFIELRANNLQRGLQTLLNDLNNSGLVRRLYDHPLIKSTSPPASVGRSGKPPKIPSHSFTLALFDLLVNGENNGQFKTLKDLSTISEAIDDSSVELDPSTQRQLKILDDTANNIQDMRLLVEQWYNDMMDRVAEWYERKAKVIVLIIAAIVTIALNADTIMLFNRLATDSAIRQTLTIAAENLQLDTTAFADDPSTDPEVVGEPGDPDASATNAKPDVTATPDSAATAAPDDGDNGDTTESDTTTDDAGNGTTVEVDTPDTQVEVTTQANGEALSPEELENLITLLVDDLQLIGWSTQPDDPRSLPTDPAGWVLKIIGLALTTVAVSLGAPFWYDIIQNLTGRNRSKSSDNTNLANPPSESRG